MLHVRSPMFSRPCAVDGMPSGKSEATPLVRSESECESAPDYRAEAAAASDRRACVCAEV